MSKILLKFLMRRTPFLTDILLYQQKENKDDDNHNQFLFNLDHIPDLDIFTVNEEENDQNNEADHTLTNETHTIQPKDNRIPDKFKEIKNISITKKDLRSLGSRQWLNDEVINSYLAYLHNTHIESKIGFTNTFFYVSLKQNGNEYTNKWDGIFRYRIDIFSHFLIPITTGAHWFLLDLDFDNKAMNVYDSMSHRYTSYTKKINEFLAFQGIPPLEVKYPSVPSQSNGYDCGVFLLKFATMIFENRSIKKNSFGQKEINSFRSQIKEILSKSVSPK